jgi:cold shock CspA family protein
MLKSIEKAVWKRGVVTFYKSDEGCKYGFILPSDGTDPVFFHNTRQCTFVYDGNSEPGQRGWINEPQKGQKVVFIENKGPRGPRASLWGDADNYDSVKKEWDGRKRYRLRQRHGPKKLSRLHPHPEMRTMWEGDNLYELRHNYSKNHYHVYDRPDAAMFFEVYENNCWTPCEDPR